MPKLNFLAILLFAGLFLTCCSVDPCMSKKQFIYSYETFIDKISEDGKDYSESDWKKKDEKFDQLVSECYQKYEEKLSPSEKKSFWVKYLKYKIKRHGSDFFVEIEKETKETTIDIEGELEDLFDNPEEDIKMAIKEIYGDDLEEAIDQVVNEVGKLGDRLKEWLEK